jgi:hypothetical protein
MVNSVDFDFHHSFLVISALFVASVLAILYLSHLFALALLVYRERVAPNGGGIGLGHTGWRKKVVGL